MKRNKLISNSRLGETHEEILHNMQLETFFLQKFFCLSEMDTTWQVAVCLNILKRIIKYLKISSLASPPSRISVYHVIFHLP